MKDLASHILDIVQNSIRAKAGRIDIGISEEPEQEIFRIVIGDDGEGMDAVTLRRAEDPFFTSRTIRKVGLGLPLFRQNAERTGGYFQLRSQPGQGTVVTASFGHTHPDRPPLGDIAGTLLLLAIANPAIHFRYEHSTPRGSYIFDTEEIENILDGVPLSQPEISRAVGEMIRGNIKAIAAEQPFPPIATNKNNQT